MRKGSKREGINPEDERITPNGRRIDISKKRKREKIWRSNNPENQKKSNASSRKHYYKKLYNITLDTFNELFEKQNGCCAICGRHQSEVKQTLSIDHSHVTDAVRGLLCHRCNMGLGCFLDRIDFLRSAEEYLKNSNCK